MKLKTGLTYNKQYKQTPLNEAKHEHPLEKYKATSLKFAVGLEQWGGVNTGASKALASTSKALTGTSKALSSISRQGINKALTSIIEALTSTRLESIHKKKHDGS